ncbi:MAG: TrkA family potassium uptake protein [Acidimicrobiia bacterium]|nr:TrkA family potassium uptake protein [Acidimicrobiia bacterium]
MHVVVIGCGRVGSELAGALERMEHTVAVIDKKKDAFSRLPKGFGGYRLVGFGFDRDTLEAAGVRDAGAVAAVTSGDNSNIMAARVARETFDVEHVVARIYDPRRAVIYQRLGIPTVATVAWTTEQVLRRLLPTPSVADWTDAAGGVGLVERNLPAVWAGKKLDGLGEPGVFSLAAVTRLGAGQVVRPDLVGQEGDILHLMANLANLDVLESKLAKGPEH